MSLRYERTISLSTEKVGKLVDFLGQLNFSRETQDIPEVTVYLRKYIKNLRNIMEANENISIQFLFDTEEELEEFSNGLKKY